MANVRTVVLLTGEIAAGKSSLADFLRKAYNFRLFKTRDAIKERFNSQPDTRIDLQREGEELDKKTEGAWVLSDFQKQEFTYVSEGGNFIVDSIRIASQINHFRKAYGYSVKHIHLHCSPATLFKRYLERKDIQDTEQAREDYKKIKINETEANVHKLLEKADLVIDTDRSTIEDVAIRALGFLGLLPDYQQQLVDVLIGAQFGSEGKGQVCGYLAPEYDALMRVGGPNAGHTVFGEPPQKYHLLPSGTKNAPRTKLLLGPGTVIRYDVLDREIKQFEITTDRLVIDANATIITSKDRKNDQQYATAIGGTGQGVGPAVAGNILNRGKTAKHKAKHFKPLKGFIGSTYDELDALFRSGRRVLLEGTQGTHLSLHHGIYPYVTSRETTVSGCLAEAGIAPRRVRRIILVTRSYPIRVESPKDGTSGGFISNELTWETIAERSGIDLEELLKTETTTTTKRKRRVAEFSWTLFRKSCELNSPTDIAFTFSDYISKENRNARRFEQLTPFTIALINEIERCASAPVSLISTRFDYRCIIDRRNWKNV